MSPIPFLLGAGRGGILLHRAEGAQPHLELVPTIAAQGAERIPGQALGVQPRRHIVATEDIAAHDGDVLPSHRRLFQNATIWKSPKRVGRSATPTTFTQTFPVPKPSHSWSRSRSTKD
jgi:hypothetical protein